MHQRKGSSAEKRMIRWKAMSVRVVMELVTTPLLETDFPMSTDFETVLSRLLRGRKEREAISDCVRREEGAVVWLVIVVGAPAKEPSFWCGE
jgi:hypothetical protein